MVNKGHILSIERVALNREFLQIMANSETNYRLITDIKRANFIKWRSNALRKKKSI